MDERAMGPEEGPLQRARLHIRGAKRRLRQGKISAGLVTLYDAVCAALEWYVASPERQKGLLINKDDDLRNDRILFEILTRSGVLDGTFDYPAFDALVEAALNTELAGFDYEAAVQGIESVMTQLGVMPFDETKLPAEDPSTF